MMKWITYIIHYNSYGCELARKSVSSDINITLSKLLSSGEWSLYEGDTIKIESKQIEY